MRIISDFNDYYDISLAHGVDMTIPFVRKTEVFLPRKKDDAKWADLTVNVKPLISEFEKMKKMNRCLRDHLNPSCFVMSFCGKIYYCVEFLRDEHLWTFDSLDAKMEKTDYWTKKRKYPFRSSKEKWIEIYKNSGSKSKCTNAHIQFRSPIIAYGNVENRRSEELVISPKLKDRQFVTVYDPYSAFQEVEMFVTSLLHPEPDMAEISDKDRLAKHGFDKWSFKKIGAKSSFQ